MSAITLRSADAQPSQISLAHFRLAALENFWETARQYFLGQLDKIVPREAEKAERRQTLMECRLPTGELVFGDLAREQSLESLADWSSETASFILAFILLMSTLWIVGG